MYITGDPKVAAVIQHCGVDWIFLDLEIQGKEARQAGLNAVISRHSLADVRACRAVIEQSLLLVRVNAWNHQSPEEIESVIDAGADIVMLPWFKSADEVAGFVDAVGGRATTCILVETREAMENIDSILAVAGVDHAHIGLNDLHLDLGKTWMFEPLVTGEVEYLAERLKAASMTFGVGGCGRVGHLSPPAEDIIAEHYRLGSTSVILSRSFYNTDTMSSWEDLEECFRGGVQAIRDWERELLDKDPAFFEANRQSVRQAVFEVVENLRAARSS